MKLLLKLFFFAAFLCCQLPASIALAEDKIIRIKDEHFSFRLSDRSRFLSAAETVRILIEAWGQTRAQVQKQNPLGMIVDKNFSRESGLIGVVVTATHEGHVEDQKATRILEITRHLPLYAVRVLGRETAVHFHGFGRLEQIDAMQKLMKSVLASSAFDRGYRYEDFNARYHRIAAYGLTPPQPKLKTVPTGAPILLLVVLVGGLVVLGRWAMRRRLPEF